MALQLPKINLADAKTRVAIILGGVLGFVVIVYAALHFLSSKSATTGSSHVASAPGGMQSVPGGQLTPEYYRALVQANAQAAKQAKISGGSAVPTLLNEPGAQPSFPQQTTSSCTVVCPTEENVDVQNDLDDLVKAGKLSAQDAATLGDLAKKNVAVSEFAAQLDTLVKQGKLSPEQARKLLDDYKKQHQNALLRESGQAMDAMIKSGELPLDAANELLEMQKNHATAAEYADKLSDLVKQGKITPATAAKLLAQYTQQQAKEAAADARGQLEEMAATGQIAPDVAKELEGYQDRHVSPQEYEEELQHLVKQGKLTPEQAKRLLDQYTKLIPPDVAATLADYQRRNVPVEEYQAELQRLVKQGKLTPEQADELLDEYRKVKQAGQPPSVMSGIVKQAESANEAAVRQLAESGRISPETADRLLKLEQAKVPIDEYKRQLDELVREGKLSPDDAQKLLLEYMQQRGAGVQDLLESGKISPETAQKLLALQAADVPVDEYRRQLEELVKEGKISKEDAQRLLNNYAQLKSAKDQAAGIAGVQDLLNAGKISPETAQKLIALQKANVPIEEYKRQLDEMVREGKISRADADKLLSNYEKMQGAGVQELLAEGKISPETAQKLMALQAQNVPIDEYKRQLDEMVREGKISPEDAQKLYEAYMRERGAGVQDLLAAGRISPDTAQKLMALQAQNVPVDEYKRQLDELVKEGKISKEDAQQLLKNYQQLRGGGTALEQLAGARRLPPDVEQKLLQMQAANVPVSEYKKQIDELVRQGKITPAEAQDLLQKYQKLHDVREEADRLAQLRGNNVPVSEYADELKRAVAAGILTPDEAAQLLQEYQASKAQAAVAPAVNIPGNNKAFAELQKRVNAAQPAVAAPKPAVTREQFGVVASKSRAMEEKAQQERIQALIGSMSSQAGSLISSWQPPVMSGVVGSAESEAKAAAKTSKTATNASASANGTENQSSASNAAAPIIKAGTIVYGVLDTAINSDYPDTPVLATIVDGPYKGAKLLGKIVVTKDQDRVSLTFKLMNMDAWTSGKTINAYAIDPDTARTALASNVNYHYFMRYGGLFASSFLQGYASAISNSGATTSSGVFGTTTTHASFSPSEKIMSGLGQVGTTLGTAVSSYTSTPPTVKIDPGVSLGILFMQDVAG